MKKLGGVLSKEEKNWANKGRYGTSSAGREAMAKESKKVVVVTKKWKAEIKEKEALSAEKDELVSVIRCMNYEKKLKNQALESTEKDNRLMKKRIRNLENERGTRALGISCGNYC